ncbi:MAG: bifunctional diguanylate cyclase/phosphodiesterase [Actinomycetota bacterium]
MARRPLRALSRRSALVAVFAGTVGAGTAILSTLGAVTPINTAFVMVGGHAVASAAAALATHYAAVESTGVARKVWAGFSRGLLLWSLSCLLYILFLVQGGSPLSPATWTQLGFLAAYPFWYRALWLLRQPVLARSRRQRVETAVVETVALGLIGVVLGAILWIPSLAAGQNIALLLPAVLDLLLMAGLYNAVRRSRVSRGSAFWWFALAFTAFAVTDIAVNFLVPRGHYATGGLALTGYAVALGFFGASARRPVRISETQSGFGRSTAVVGVFALAMVAPAGVLLTGNARYAVWAVGVLLLCWLWSRITVEGLSEIDPLTGFLLPNAFERHLAGVLALATPERPASLIVSDINGFSDWRATQGFAAGDALISETAAALEGLEMPEGGAWARLTTDRFAWLGMIGDASSGRAAAFRISGITGESRPALGSATGFALVPGDAETPADALAAAQEAMLAARSGNRSVVAFDRGRLDGVPTTSGYSTSIRRRRARIEEIIASAEALEPAFQPIVSTVGGAVQGYEALSRFHAEPAQGPDRWIAEAHAVGMGIELEAECLRRALMRRNSGDGVPGTAYLSLNASPQLLLSDLLDRIVGTGRLDRVVFEITEHHHVADYAELADRLALLRGRGARVAIDDVGAGHSSMRHVMNLRPDYIKVDRWMVDGIHLDSAKRALLRSLTALARELHAVLIAEGVETAEELRVLQDLGVDCAQGYLFARPRHEFVTIDDIPLETLALVRATSGPDGEPFTATPVAVAPADGAGI